MPRPLRGTVRVVPDKSITHRGVLLGLVSEGRSVLLDPNPGEDCRATLRAVAALGARVEEREGAWVIEGGCPREPEDVLDLGNSGTGIRLLAGLLSGHPFLSVLTGDASLRRRPMSRIIRPLSAMGARIEAREDGRAPLVVRGGTLRGIDYDSPIASAQVKSAILLAGLSLPEGRVRIRERTVSRDHTERLLRWSGVTLRPEEEWLVLESRAHPRSGEWRVPGDLSAAVFLLVGAAITPNSRVTVERVGLNPTRTGALDVLRRMGARLQLETAPDEGPEPIGTVTVEHGPLQNVEVSGDEVPRLIDEIPVLAVAAACADGVTRFRDVGELRLKESDRIRTTCAMLRALGVEAEEEEHAFLVRGRGWLEGGHVAALGDHRIAMSAHIAAGAARGEVSVDSEEMIATSDPGFFLRLEALRGGRS